MFGKTIKLDYVTNKPDHSEIDVKQGFETIGNIKWDEVKHAFLYTTLLPNSADQLIDIKDSLDKLNKAANPPKWIAWK